jgi:hypothetical protein
VDDAHAANAGTPCRGQKQHDAGLRCCRIHLMQVDVVLDAVLAPFELTQQLGWIAVLQKAQFFTHLHPCRVKAHLQQLARDGRFVGIKLVRVRSRFVLRGRRSDRIERPHFADRLAKKATVVIGDGSRWAALHGYMLPMPESAGECRCRGTVSSETDGLLR